MRFSRASATAAAGADVPAIDTAHTNLRDHAGLERQARAARRDGLAGKLAVHPKQVEILGLDGAAP